MKISQHFVAFSEYINLKKSNYRLKTSIKGKNKPVSSELTFLRIAKKMPISGQKIHKSWQPVLLTEAGTYPQFPAQTIFFDRF